MQGYVVVSGLPASGKTTVARTLAHALPVPFLDKDDFLEDLFRLAGIGDPAWRRQLSQRADVAFQRAALAEPAAVLTSWWKHPASTLDSGTPTSWLVTPPGLALEVHCTCDPSVAADRFLRRRRHPGHLDERWSRETLLAMLMEQRRHGPLFPARSLVIDTQDPLDLSGLNRAIEVALPG